MKAEGCGPQGAGRWEWSLLRLAAPFVRGRSANGVGAATYQGFYILSHQYPWTWLLLQDFCQTQGAEHWA